MDLHRFMHCRQIEKLARPNYMFRMPFGLSPQSLGVRAEHLGEHAQLN